jgi:hypothetical protein
MTICAGRLARAGCELPKIERDGEQLKRYMSRSGLWWTDDDDYNSLYDEDIKLILEKVFTSTSMILICHRR